MLREKQLAHSDASAPTALRGTKGGTKEGGLNIGQHEGGSFYLRPPFLGTHLAPLEHYRYYYEHYYHHYYYYYHYYVSSYDYENPRALLCGNCDSRHRGPDTSPKGPPVSLGEGGDLTSGCAARRARWASIKCD